CLMAVWTETGKHGISIAFGRRVCVIALGVFTLLAFWNHEAWIMNRNIDRAAVTGKFDGAYARRLSHDATPTLIARRMELPPAERPGVESWLQCIQPLGGRRWFEWNRSVWATQQALQKGNVGPCAINRTLTQRLPGLRAQ
ncbi:MAG: DUF4153 domain-containing protein, partial [Gemmatimonadaceae bacterium]